MHKVFGAAVLLFAISCNNVSGDVVMNAVNGKWDKKKDQNFDLNITDPQMPKNIIFVVRNNNDYPYSNIRFIVDMKDPKGKTGSVDTLNYILAQPNGEWIGTGFGETKETLFQYKTDYKFQEKGVYKVSVKQAMRTDVLPGIEDLGIKVETANTAQNNGKQQPK